MMTWASSPHVETKNFLLLDRDGVINIDRSDYIKRWEEFQFYPDSLDALRWLHEQRVHVIIVSNQSALHRGITSYEDFWDIHNRMIERIQAAGGSVLAAFYCPHRPDEGCSCRKPNPGMILAASTLYRFPLEKTCFIGDRVTDMLAAHGAGCRGILLDRFPERREPCRDILTFKEMRRCHTFMEAAFALREILHL